MSAVSCLKLSITPAVLDSRYVHLGESLQRPGSVSCNGFSTHLPLPRRLNYSQRRTSHNQSRAIQTTNQAAPKLTTDNKGLVFPGGDPGSWDAGGVANPVVRRYVSDNEERWCMWYTGKGEGSSSGIPLAGLNTGGVGLATSSNGLHWARGSDRVVTDEYGQEGVGLVMEPNPDWWTFDTRAVSVSDVQIMSSQVVRAQSGVYWMYYSGGDAEELPLPEALSGPRDLGTIAGTRAVKVGTKVEGLRTRPGLAMSYDGRNWARIEGDQATGALFDVGTGEGKDAEWDSLCVSAPQVIFHAPGDLRMYYHSVNPETGSFMAGFARSKEGVRWVKFGKILGRGQKGAFDECGVAARHVVAIPEGYAMAYEGVAADNARSIGLATSKDGLWNWERSTQGPILSPSEDKDAWDGHSVGSPCLVSMGGDGWRLYYIGVGRNGESGIGLAESRSGLQGPFVRWEGSTLPSV